jgi:hypothetical protein
MAYYIKEHFNDDHAHKDHIDCGLKYIVHKLDEPLLEFSSPELSGKVTYVPDADIFHVSGQFNIRGAAGATMKYWAANPIGRIYSYSGSALPYPNPEAAYENTTNQGTILLDNEGKFHIKLDHPSGYYVGQGKILLKSHVHFKVSGYNRVFTVTIADYFPYRSLKNLPDRPNRSTNR